MWYQWVNERSSINEEVVLVETWRVGDRLGSDYRALSGNLKDFKGLLCRPQGTKSKQRVSFDVVERGLELDIRGEK